ncbi:response regulator transcription factor [Streptomyces sp. NBC_01795]|uniref:response regulator transcription factor n=1 Tax=Streptomyces sp. NBC_01795 TaxID=2975943 RepID=UPI002DD8FD36|nr:response regulator transcription factor [Streptomyces sp. NBC_01795]WSA93912.1 response regulator transcription factor [Streptomyces sp. NBC_01795]
MTPPVPPPQDPSPPWDQRSQQRQRGLPVRVLLADDDPLVRAGLKMMLRGARGVEVVGETADGAEVPAAVREFTPDVILMDIRMPTTDGITATRALAASPPPGIPMPQVIVLTTFDSDTEVLEAIRAGAAGYLLKHTDPEEIVAAVLRAARGEPVLSPSVARTLMDHAADAAAARSRGERARSRAEVARARMEVLSERERVVAGAVAEGLANSEIAERLYLSVGSVKAHVSSALSKLGLDNRIRLALLAHDAGHDTGPDPDPDPDSDLDSAPRSRPTGPPGPT